ncbi:uncharacterized protein AB675_11856 [Cyphellophora attinorum]|uniref:Uncharacterized protein n=1 Tax=Cyphellophora attinorum TaxID=1664694 RepID=A0A0N1NX71_9EURO|nr:uncharacterized protein AB675_11856 [Phialophora attinorum]KPI36830.1 hypothetical protein AB675_11856 [Phialophora attinorum]
MSRSDLLALSASQPGWTHSVSWEDATVFLQNFLFTIGMSPDELCQDNRVLMQTLPPFISLLQRMVSWRNAGDSDLVRDRATVVKVRDVLFEDEPQNTNMQGYGHVIGNSLFLEYKTSILPFRGDDFTLDENDLICLQPANIRFPEEYAKMYSTGFLVRARSDGPKRNLCLCGILIASHLQLKHLDEIPPDLVKAIATLQEFGRDLDDAMPGMNDEVVTALKCPTMPYLRLLAQFRQLVLLLRHWRSVRNQPYIPDADLWKQRAHE